MEKSITEYLTITKDELYNMIKKASTSACNDKYFNSDIFDNLINDFITKHISNKQIDQITDEEINIAKRNITARVKAMIIGEGITNEILNIEVRTPMNMSI